jgi:hypothetical protein
MSLEQKKKYKSLHMLKPGTREFVRVFRPRDTENLPTVCASDFPGCTEILHASDASYLREEYISIYLNILLSYCLATTIQFSFRVPQWMDATDLQMGWQDV